MHRSGDGRCVQGPGMDSHGEKTLCRALAHGKDSLLCTAARQREIGTAKMLCRVLTHGKGFWRTAKQLGARQSFIARQRCNDLPLPTAPSLSPLSPFFLSRPHTSDARPARLQPDADSSPPRARPRPADAPGRRRRAAALAGRSPPRPPLPSRRPCPPRARPPRGQLRGHPAATPLATPRPPRCTRPCPLATTPSGQLPRPCKG
jgi:hypothetical protein